MKIFKARPHAFKVALLLLALPLAGHAITTDSGKSFFSPQPISTTLAPQTSMLEEFARKHGGDERFFFSATPFYSKSQAAQNLRRYFLPEGKDELVIAGSDVPAGTNYDVSGTWLKIMGSDVPAALGLGLLFNNFQSKITVNPVYENLGVNLNFYKNIGTRLFVAAECAVLQSKVTHGFAEYDVHNETTRAVTRDLAYQAAGGESRFEPESRIYSLNATEAFTNPLWQYGKLAVNPLKQNGISDLGVKAGLRLDLGSLFVKIILPTSQKPTAQYMFEPLTGNGSHLGLGLGGLLELEKELSHATVKFFNMAEYVYLLENTQLRTFDLNNNGPWSRYLIMRELNHKNSTPGVNYLTLNTHVTPGHTFNWQSRLGVKVHKISLNAGYNFSFVDQEALSLSGNNFATQFNIADEQLTDAATDLALVLIADTTISEAFLPNSTIQSPAGNSAGARNGAAIPARIDYIAAGPINASNINIQSAQQPAKLLSQLSLAVGFDEMTNDLPIGVNVGYSYSFDHNKTALAGWAMWLSVGLKV